MLKGIQLIMKMLKLEKTKPIIGLSGPSTFTSDCIDMAEKFLGSNVILLYHQETENINFWLSMCDAVVLAGGVDIHPRTYQKSIPTNKNMRTFDYRRDIREIKIINTCLERKIPMLGICRGHQLLCINRLKLNIIPDIIAESHIIHNPVRQDPKMEYDIHNTVHTVEIAVKGDYPANDIIHVNSFHHQGIAYNENECLKHELTTIGTAEVNQNTKIIELIVNKKENWMSCQWHPEWDLAYQSSSHKLLNYFKENFLHKK